MDTQTLLNYELTTEPFPLRVSTEAAPNSGNFTIVASNPTPEEPVTIKKISITILIGTAGAELSITQPPDPTPPSEWRLSGATPGDHVVEYVFKPNVGKGQVGEQGLAFIFNAIQINLRPGTVNVRVVEESADGVAIEDLKITKFPSGWGQVTFWANPQIVSAGESTAINWSGPAGATYSIEYYIPQRGIVYVPAEGEKPLANKGQYRPNAGLERNTVFNLTVKAVIDGQEYFARQSVIVTVQAVKITATGPDDPVNALEPVEINWRTISAQTVTLEPDKQTANAISGSGTFTVRPTSNTTYTLIAKDAKGREKRAIVAVYVNPPEITTFKATPAAVKPGTLVTLLWVTKSSAFTSLSPGVGKVNPTGIAKVTVPVGNTSYMLTAQSQPPFAIETVNIIGAQPGFHLMASDSAYDNADALVVGKKLFLVDVPHNRVWFSTDGQTITPVQAEAPMHEFLQGYRTIVFDAGNGPRIWILGGFNTRMDPSNSVWRSTDETGNKWEQVNPVNNKIWAPRGYFGCVIFRGKIWVFGGTDGSGSRKNDVWSSPDGANWTLETESAGWSPRAYFGATTFTLGESTNQIWLCGGMVGTEYTNECYYTHDGVQWSKWLMSKTIPWEPRAAPLLQQMGDSLWLISGSISNSTPFRDVWSVAGPPQSHMWTKLNWNVPWAVDNGGAPWTSVVFNGLMWFSGSNAQYQRNPGIWYFLP